MRNDIAGEPLCAGDRVACAAAVENGRGSMQQPRGVDASTETVLFRVAFAYAK
jgi:hypothetical protein